ncbi:DUF5518 domain-containing protein [Halobium salinum]|uniref:DUF5518 domain-containing protein n=1 Tax=Halobium salinum TaxID=1364940 RepID=A0ABD5PDM6_9EURY|nr:DUF5518 domain-containing protein [Halobium salinum]
MSTHSSSDGRLTNALIGAVVTVVLSFVPFSPVLGGAVAGYLQKRDGARVGAVSGAMAAVPALFVTVLGLLLFAGLAVVPGDDLLGAQIGFVLLALLVAGVVLAYVVGLSAVGGIVGVALAERSERRRDSARGGDDPWADERLVE